MKFKENKDQGYFESIFSGVNSLRKGLKITFKHFKDAFHLRRTSVGVNDPSYFEIEKGIVTLEYPYESIPVPDNGRYRLHNEIDDCIVCDLCAKICPVDCIEIEPVKSAEEIGKTSDGTTKRLYAAKFDIDMAKCCYCGLCTTVCPTECLTMTKTYDYSEFDIRDMVYHFTNLTPEESQQKKKEFEEKQKEKAAAKKETPAVESKENAGEKKVSFKPSIKKPDTSSAENPVTEKKETTEIPTPKPSFKPIIKAPAKQEEQKDEVQEEKKEEIKPKPFKPVIKAPVKKEEEPADKKEETKSEDIQQNLKPKPVFKPVIKPPVQKKDDNENKKEDDNK